jgi:hypothetical protein
MNTQMVVLYVVAGALFLLYMFRRRSRMSREDE